MFSKLRKYSIIMKITEIPIRSRQFEIASFVLHVGCALFRAIQNILQCFLSYPKFWVVSDRILAELPYRCLSGVFRQVVETICVRNEFPFRLTHLSNELSTQPDHYLL